MSDAPKSSMYFVRKYEIPPDHAVVVIGPDGSIHVDTAPDKETGEGANITVEIIRNVIDHLDDQNMTVGQFLFDVFISIGYTSEQAQQMLDNYKDTTHSNSGAVH